MFDKLIAEENRYEELSRLLSTAEVQADPQEMRKHAKALAELEPLVEKYREYKAAAQQVAELTEMAANRADAACPSRRMSVARIQVVSRRAMSLCPEI